MATYTTGYSAPPSELDVSIVNISSSSGSTAIVPAPTKRSRPTTTANTVAIPPQGGSPVAYVGTTYATPALVATSVNVDQPNTYHNITSSGSSISVTSTASRQRRADLARAKRELAEARLEELEADLELAAGSQAGSVGRRLDDVQSEVGSTRHEEPLDPTRPLLPTDVAQQQQPIAREEPNLFEGVFSPAREEAPSIYEVFSKARGVHIIDDLLVPDGPRAPLPRMTEPPSDVGLPSPSQEGMHPATMDMSPYRVVLPSQEGPHNLLALRTFAGHYPLH